MRISGNNNPHVIYLKGSGNEAVHWRNKFLLCLRDSSRSRWIFVLSRSASFAVIVDHDPAKSEMVVGGLRSRRISFEKLSSFRLCEERIVYAISVMVRVLVVIIRLCLRVYLNFS